MGLFRALIVGVIGILSINLITRSHLKINKVPIIGPKMQKYIKNNEAYILVLLITISQLVL